MRNFVALFTGAWIEIGSREVRRRVPAVAPFTGAWIEIAKADGAGLQHLVALFAGAWIGNATTYGSLPAVYAPRRSLNWKTDHATLNHPDNTVFLREHALKLFFPQNSVKNCIPSKHEYELLLRYSVNLFMPFSCS